MYDLSLFFSFHNASVTCWFHLLQKANCFDEGQLYELGKKGRLVIIVPLNGEPSYMNAINSILPDGRVS